MAHIIAASVGEQTTTTGTGNYSLIGIIGTRYKPFGGKMSIGDWFYGYVEAVDSLGIPTGEWEEGLYTYTASNTLGRTAVHASSNDGAPVSWGAGTKHVYMAFTSYAARQLFSGSMESNVAGAGSGTVTYAALPAAPADGGSLSLLRDHVYWGTLDLTSKSNVTITASGTGQRPVIAPGALVTSWTLHSGNIYKATFGDFTPTMLHVDRAACHTSHLPVRATRWYTSDSGSPDNQIYYTPPTADIVGAKCFIRVHNSAEEERTVTAYSSGVITLDNTPENGTSNKEFYLEGRLSMLTESNSWCYDSGEIYLWCADGLDPTGKEVIATSSDYAIDCASSTNVTLSSIGTLGGSRGVSAQSSTNLNVQVGKILNATHYGVYAGGSLNPTINGCEVIDCLRNGIDMWYGTHSVDITNNTVSNIGMVGMPKTSHGGIHIGSESNEGTSYSNLVKNNVVTNSCYHGIQVTRNLNCTVEDNIVAGFCQGFNDGGGIYTGVPIRTPLNMIIQRNTVSGGITGDPTGGVGIYLDDSANDVQVLNNTVSQCDTNYLLHNAFDTVTSGNTFIALTNDCIIQIALSANDLPSGPANTRMYNNVITGNTVRTESSDTQTYNLQAADNMPNWMTANNNTYQMAFGTGSRFARTWDGVGSGINRDYDNWKSFMGVDAASTYTVL